MKLKDYYTIFKKSQKKLADLKAEIKRMELKKVLLVKELDLDKREAIIVIKEKDFNYIANLKQKNRNLEHEVEFLNNLFSESFGNYVYFDRKDKKIKMS